MDNLDLPALRALHAAATPGPWECGGKVLCDCGSSPNCWHQYKAQNDIFPPLGESGPVATVSAVEYNNADWLTAIHNAFPAILDRLETAERERDYWKRQQQADFERLNQIQLVLRDYERRLTVLTETIASGKAFEPPPMLLKSADGSLELIPAFAARMKALGAAEAWDLMLVQANLRGDHGVAAYAEQEAARLRREAKSSS